MSYHDYLNQSPREADGAIMIINKSWPEYLGIRLLILLMKDLGLLCLGYFFIAFLFGGVRAVTHPASLVIEVLGAIEILWYFLFFLPCRWLLQNYKPYTPPPMNRTQRAWLFRKAISLTPDMETWIRMWANNAHMEDIRVDNVKDWLLWGLFERDGMKDLGPDVEAELDGYIEEIKQGFGIALKPGRGTAESVRLSFDPIDMRHRSLTYYMLIGYLDGLVCLWLLATGYKFYRQPVSSFFKAFPFRPIALLSPHASAAPGMSFWYRPHRSTTRRPVIIIHGLGLGIVPYQFWMATIPKDVGIIAVELLPVSTRVTIDPLAPTAQICDDVAAIAAQVRKVDPGKWDDFVLVTSSYGTMFVAPLIRHPDFGPRISGNILCDPVSLLLHLPQVAYNFTRRTPRPSIRGHPGWGNEWEIWWASATDAGTAHTLARRFCWRESILWREDLIMGLRNAEMGRLKPTFSGESARSGVPHVGMRTTVIQGGEDCIAPAKHVAAYVYSGNVNYTQADMNEWTEYKWTGTAELELVFMDGLDHGQGMMVPRPSMIIRKVVDGYCRRDLTKATAGFDVAPVGGGQFPNRI
ncbi:hypothetical protein RB595_008753 [Gaeumannomyces hyphopodioides]